MVIQPSRQTALADPRAPEESTSHAQQCHPNRVQQCYPNRGPAMIPVALVLHMGKPTGTM